MSLASGLRLGPYEITAPLGAGGMGEVYRATDTNLKRAVAIKVLPESLASDASRLARFQREAEVLAALNHPHIAAIYGLERSDGVTALIMELVEGPTLADRIVQGAIPVEDTIAIARQIAEGLEAAHSQGIIHRDLKPANIKIRPDGHVKVLDFGLAKTPQPAGLAASGASVSPTITSPALMTAAGVLLGTAAYMSPEQVRGTAVDKRSDIWSFGVVLFEMLTGRRAFPGDEIADVLAAVLTREPDWTLLPASLSPDVSTLLRLCLHKIERSAFAILVTPGSRSMAHSTVQVTQPRGPPRRRGRLGNAPFHSPPLQSLLDFSRRSWPGVAGHLHSSRQRRASNSCFPKASSFSLRSGPPLPWPPMADRSSFRRRPGCFSAR